jgi:hypothetical protein
LLPISKEDVHLLLKERIPKEADVDALITVIKKYKK